MANVQVALTRSSLKVKVFSDMIIWWDRFKNKAEKPISHVSFKWTAKSWQRDLFYQAHGHQTTFNGGTQFYSRNQVIELYELDLPAEVEAKIGKACVDREGLPYAIKQTIGIFISGIVYVLTFRKHDIDNPLSDGELAVNCLEEVARILISEAGATPFPGNLDKATPWEFRQWLRQQTFAKEVTHGA